MSLFAALWIGWSIFSGIFYYITDKQNPEGRLLHLWAKIIFVLCIGLVLALVAFTINKVFGLSDLFTNLLVLGLWVVDKFILKLEFLAFPADFIASHLCLKLERVFGPARRA